MFKGDKNISGIIDPDRIVFDCIDYRAAIRIEDSAIPKGVTSKSVVDYIEDCNEATIEKSPKIDYTEIVGYKDEKKGFFNKIKDLI